MIKLFDFERSGNCYKIRLFLSILNVDYQKIPINIKADENKTKEFLTISPNGLVPVLIDNKTTISDSAAILTYLANVYANDDWLPKEPVQFSNVVKWLAFEQSEVRYGLFRARAMVLNNPTPLAKLGTLKESQTIAKLALEILNQQLTHTKWLAEGGSPTICDIACYPYVAMSEEGKISLKTYTAINQWIARIKNLGGYISLPS